MNFKLKLLHQLHIHLKLKIVILLYGISILQIQYGKSIKEKNQEY